VIEALAGTIRQEKGYKWENIKSNYFQLKIILSYAQCPKYLTRKIVETINSLSKMLQYISDVQNLQVLIYMNNKHAEKEIVDMLLFPVSQIK
jgi:predicted SPOUT superfamily RNA methylase MTH1